MSDSNLAIEVKEVSLTLNGHKILNQLSLTANLGETTVLVGPSGCGKTMLLRSLVGLQSIDQGSISLLGEKIKNYKSKPVKRITRSEDKNINRIRSRVGLVFQHLYLWPHKSVLQNIIEAPLSVLQESKEVSIARAYELLDLVGLTHKANAYPQTLSGGEQQRVAIIRALAMKPELLLLDEITSALDPELVNDVLEIIRNLLTWNMTFLIVTHEMSFAQDVADQILFMDQGQIIESGKPDLFFDAPETQRAKQFLERLPYRKY